MTVMLINLSHYLICTPNVYNKVLIIWERWYLYSGEWTENPWSIYTWKFNVIWTTDLYILTSKKNKT